MAMPQVHWAGSHDPAAQLAKSAAQCRAIKAFPVVPTAFSDNGWSPTSGQIMEFLTESKKSHRHLTSSIGTPEGTIRAMDCNSIVPVVAANGDVNVSM